MQHSKIFDISPAFLWVTITELSTLKQVRFWLTLYINPTLEITRSSHCRQLLDTSHYRRGATPDCVAHLSISINQNRNYLGKTLWPWATVPGPWDRSRRNHRPTWIEWSGR